MEPDKIIIGNQEKEKYEAPKVEFVPLKIEERLLSCTKGMIPGGGTCVYGNRGS